MITFLNLNFHGCVIFNAQYLQGEENKLPEESDVLQMLEDIKCRSRKGIDARNETERINMMVAWNSRKVVKCAEQIVNDDMNHI